SDIVDGSSTETAVDYGGNLYLRVTKRIQPNANPITISSETYSNPDQFNRPQKVTYLDGTVAYTYYGCCGGQTNVGKDGTHTDYIYDALRRQIGVVQTNLGIVTINGLDALGNVLTVTRVGSDDSAILQQSTSYDSAGRIHSQYNPLDGLTTYDYANGG